MGTMKLLETLLDKLPAYIYWINTDGKFEGCNAKFASLAGVSNQNLINGLYLKDLKFNGFTHIVPAWINNNETAISPINTKLIFEENYPALNKNQIFCRSYKLTIENERKIVGLLNISLDITDEIKNVAESQDEKDELEVTLNTILANIPGHIYWQNKQGIILGCNERQARSLGFSSSHEVKGKHPNDLIPKKEADAILEVLNRVATTGESILLEETITFKQGILNLLSHKVPLKNKHGEIYGMLGLSVDISKQKELENKLIQEKQTAEAANKTKTEFLENMRHDLRTPLTGITGIANILKKEAKGTKFEEYADNIAESGESLLFLLNEILEAVHVTCGDAPLLRLKFNFKKILNDIIKLNQPKAKEKKLILTLNYDQNIPNYCIADAKRIQRIALELVTNALNFTDQGSVIVATELAKKEGRNFVIKLIVTDTGIGIPYDKKQEIFTRFKRLTPSYQGHYKGAGLGLTIVKQFIDELDGEIYVESEVQKGTKFTCIIPLKETLLDDDFGTAIIDTNLRQTQSIHQTHRNATDNQPLEENNNHLSQALLVEDNPIAAKIIMTHLNNLECVIKHAHDGKTAVLMALNKRFDIILMDIGLPDISGIEVTQQIRQNESSREVPVPIVALTAHVDSKENLQCMQAGMNAVLPKPIEENTMRDILNAFIPHRIKSISFPPANNDNSEKIATSDH